MTMGFHPLCTYYLAFSENQGGESRGPQQYLLSSSSGHTFQQGHLAYWFQSPCPWPSTPVSYHPKQCPMGRCRCLSFGDSLKPSANALRWREQRRGLPRSAWILLCKPSTSAPPASRSAQPCQETSRNEKPGFALLSNTKERHNSCRLLRQAETYSTASSERWKVIATSLFLPKTKEDNVSESQRGSAWPMMDIQQIQLSFFSPVTHSSPTTLSSPSYCLNCFRPF